MFWARDEKIMNWLPSLQAHRGYWVDGASQNSLESIKKAFDKKYRMVEFDVRLTKDFIVVLFHDEMLNGVPIEKYDYNQISYLNRLEDVMKWFCQKQETSLEFDFKLNIEIKSKSIWNKNLEKEVLKLIQKYGLKTKVLISSFNPFSLSYFRKYEVEIYRAFLLSTNSDSSWLTRYLLENFILNFLARPHLLHLDYQNIKLKKYKDLSKKIPVVLWTVNRFEIFKEHQKIISGIISDEITPEMMSRISGD